MLKIRAEQFKAFQPVAEEDFERRLVRHLREHHGEQVVRLSGTASATVEQIPEEDLRAMVRGGIARARAYGMALETSVTSFVVLMFVTAPNFDSHPLIKHVLSEESVAPDARIDQLWERTTEPNWKMAVQNYDAGAWHLKSQEGSA